MKQKILTIIFGMVLLIGILGVVSAEEYTGVINNISGIYINDFVAGGTTTANFSFDYLDSYGLNEYPHILQINITSNNTNFPVWKNDFKLNGFIKKYRLWPFPLYYNINLNCSEKSPLTINSQLGPNTLNVLNGTFYCYNTTSNILNNLKKHDEVHLTIKSHPALWPGKYNLSARIFYFSDTLAPFVNITNKDALEKYYKPGNYLEVKADIIENVGLSNYFGTIFDKGTEYSIPFWKKDTNGEYYFTETSIPNNLTDGNYDLTITAIDTSGNIGEDNATLKIDNRGPEITLIQPTNNSVYSDILPIELNVTDAKSGVNQSSVYYELAAVVSGIPCPDTGIGINASCYNSKWVNLHYNDTTETYSTEINTTALNLSSGSYWLYAKAFDNLGNEGDL